MIRITHTSDLHIDQLSKWSPGKSSKIDGLSEFSEIHLGHIQEIVNDAIKNKSNLFVFAGDLFHDSVTNHKEKDVINKELIRMINQLKDHNIYSVFLSGNHDTTKRLRIQQKANTLELFHSINYNEFLFVNSPASNELDYKDYTFGEESIRVILFPYLREYKVEEGIDAKQQLRKQLELLVQERPENSNCVIVGHLDIFGALYNGVEIQSMDTSDINTWTPQELESLQADLVLLGHVHNSQEMGESKSVIYCGSPYRLSFNEEGVDKGFYTHELSLDTIKSKFTKLDVANWVTFNYSIDPELEEGLFTKLLEDLKSHTKLKGSIVRIKISNIQKQHYKYIPHREIMDILESHKIFLFRGISYSELIQSNDAHKDEEVLTSEFLSTQIEPKSILESILKKDGYDEKYIEECLLQLDTIITTINE